MNKDRVKWLVLAGSVVVAILVGRWMMDRAERKRPLVDLIDNTEELMELLESSQQADPDLPPMSPDEFVTRAAWTPDTVKRFYPMIKYEDVFQSHDLLGYRRVGDLKQVRRFEEHPKGGFALHTNSLGMRDREILDEVDVRILFAGDSQTEGVCGIEESFVNLMEAGLSRRHPGRAVDAINAGLGGTNPWYYLTLLEAYAELEPDLFVAVFFGGNDFANVIALERYYRGRGPAKSRRIAAERNRKGVIALPKGLGPVEYQQILYLLVNPDDVEFCLAAWTSISMEMDRRCREQGIEFVPVYLPPPLAGQPGVYAAERELMKELMPEVYGWVDRTNELTDRWIEDLRARDVETVDLRPAFLEATEKLYWSQDFHLNIEGQNLVGEVLEEAFAGRVAALLEG